MTTAGHLLFARLLAAGADPELARHITICCWPEPYGPDPIVFGPQAPPRKAPEIIGGERGEQVPLGDR